MKTASEKISEAVKSKMDPIPSIELQIRQEEGKDFILLHVAAGAETPYYYIGDGGRIAYIRVGNEKRTGHIHRPETACSSRKQQHL